VEKANVKREWLDSKCRAENERELSEADVWLRPGSNFARGFWEDIENELTAKGIIVKMEPPGAFLVIRPEIIFVAQSVILPIVTAIIAERLMKWYDELRTKREHSQPKTLRFEFFAKHGTEIERIEITGDPDSVRAALRDFQKEDHCSNGIS
jgi:hypothetical protein